MESDFLHSRVDRNSQRFKILIQGLVKQNKTKQQPNNPHSGNVAFLAQAELVRLPDALITPHTGQYEHMLRFP